MKNVLVDQKISLSYNFARRAYTKLAFLLKIPSLVVLILVVGMSACSVEQRVEGDQYFSIADLLDDQVDRLLSVRPQLEKWVATGKDTSMVTLQPDSLGWVDEFAIVRDMGIDKPAFAGRYGVEVSDDVNSNLTVLSYDALTEYLEVTSLAIYYLNDIENIRHIKISSHQNNSIFKSSKEVFMEFDQVDGSLFMNAYRISGFQKMILQDRVAFEVHGKVKY